MVRSPETASVVGSLHSLLLCFWLFLMVPVLLILLVSSYPATLVVSCTGAKSHLSVDSYEFGLNDSSYLSGK